MSLQLAVFVLQQVPKLLIILSLIVWYIYNMTKTIVGALRGQGLVNLRHLRHLAVITNDCYRTQQL